MKRKYYKKKGKQKIKEKSYFCTIGGGFSVRIQVYSSTRRLQAGLNILRFPKQKNIIKMRSTHI